jgi:hypothetical protein
MSKKSKKLLISIPLFLFAMYFLGIIIISSGSFLRFLPVVPGLVFCLLFYISIPISLITIALVYLGYKRDNFPIVYTGLGMFFVYWIILSFISRGVIF